ncbi:MAG: glycerol-3-phosphate 1-O-acyltransferase PlsY [Leptospira sp.]|nr:glycerol-3-phosphate 1-O-acyltransferase PlsY [Leptospira sp.]NCS95627.1 glycerol-3-phosphate 1-O-acyltransferase PlsY [Leptospira sp.]
MIIVALVLIVSFLIGAIPNGYLITNLVSGMDIRQHGSKNIGATNVGRVIGWKYGFIVLVLDALKGVLPVLFVSLYLPSLVNVNFVPDPLYLPLAAGAISILGHVYTPFLGFRGGKGVATALGVCLTLVPITTVVAIFVFFTVYKISGYVSLGSILASGSMPFIYKIFHIFFNQNNYSLTMLSILICIALLILILHRENIRRLIKGEELKAVGRGKTGDA